MLFAFAPDGDAGQPFVPSGNFIDLTSRGVTILLTKGANMSAGRDAIEQSEAFLLYLQANEKERERFEQDVLEYMVKLGESSGFEFTAEALEKVSAIKYKLENVWHPPR